MINPVIERRYADCSELVDSWRIFLDMFSRTLKGELEITPEGEQKFMETKARIAMLHDSFMESLKHDQNIGQNMLSIVNRSITLNHLRKMGGADTKKIEIEWHECYLLLNETVSQIGEEREKLAGVNELSWKMAKVREKLLLNLKAFLTSIWFKLAVVVAVIVFIIWGVPAFGIYDWNNLRKIDKLKGPYGSFLDFKRDKMRMGGAYSSMAAVDKSFANLPTGYSQGSGDVQQAQVAGMFRGAFTLQDGQDAEGALANGPEFRHLKLTTPTGDVDAFIFYWFDLEPPGKFLFSFNDAVRNKPGFGDRTKSVSVFAKENLLVILRNGDDSTRSLVKSQVFKVN